MPLRSHEDVALAVLVLQEGRGELGRAQPANVVRRRDDANSQQLHPGLLRVTSGCTFCPTLVLFCPSKAGGDMSLEVSAPYATNPSQLLIFTTVVLVTWFSLV